MVQQRNFVRKQAALLFVFSLVPDPISSMNGIISSYLAFLVGTKWERERVGLEPEQGAFRGLREREHIL